MTAATLNTIRHNADGTITEGTITVDALSAPKRTRPKPITISASDIFNRFTADEHAAVWLAATANPAIGVGLTQGLAAGSDGPDQPGIEGMDRCARCGWCDYG